MFDLTEEQQLIRDSVRRYVNDNFSLSKRQLILATEDGFDRESWQAFARLGLLGIGISETHGGVGGNLVDVALVCQELGSGLLTSPFLVSSGVAVSALQLFTRDSVKLSKLEEVAAGNIIISCALFESDDPDGEVQTSGVVNGGNLVINGCKTLVPWGAQANRILISVKIDDEVKLVDIPTTMDQIKIRPYKMYDGSRAADFELSDVSLSTDHILENSNRDSVSQLVDIENALKCAEASAMMWQIQEQTLEYMRNREQFDQTLSEMQALQHRIVDVYVKCQLAQSMAEGAVCAMADHNYNAAAQREVSGAKCHISEQSRLVGKEGIQLHGGMGMTDDIAVGHYFKRLSAIAQSNGTAEWHRNRFSRLNSQ